MLDDAIESIKLRQKQSLDELMQARGELEKLDEQRAEVQGAILNREADVRYALSALEALERVSTHEAHLRTGGGAEQGTVDAPFRPEDVLPNARWVLDLLEKHGAVTEQALADTRGVSLTTVKRRIAHLREINAVAGAGTSRGKQLFRINDGSHA